MTTTAPETVTFAVDDEVTIDHPRCHGHVYVITHVKRTKCFVKRKDIPNDRGLDAPMSMMSHYDPTKPVTPPTFAHRMPILTAQPGEVVRLKRPFQANTTSTLMVVTKVNQTSLSLDPLGGPSNGTPMRCAPQGVVKVDLASILA